MRVELPAKMAEALWKPARWKIFYGGRGATKTTSIARYYGVKAYSEKRKIICTREIQKSIQDSVHAVLEQEIINLGLKDFFNITKTSITGRNGSEFLFAGLRSNIANIKSIPGLTDGWVEEAQSATVSNIRTLAFTIREPGSEMILSLNPDLEDDPIFQEFIANPPEDSVVLKINWQDNPWFPEVLRKDMEEMKKRDYQQYLHVWEGQPKQAVEGAIFAAEILKASEEHRLTKVPVMPGVPVQTFWDLGQSDNTAIWFVQIVGMEFRIIDYYQASGHKLGHYIEVLEERGYNYDEHCLPHDAEHEQLAANSTIKQQLTNALRDNPKLGNTVRIVPRIPKKALAIDAARNIFDQCVFDKEKCADGLQCLRHAAFAKDVETGRVSKEPKHDIWSHGCLTADSLVLTRRGSIPIVDVSIGDMVWTPRGYSLVTNAGATKFTNEIIEIQMNNGALLKCTPEHKILTQKGFVTADALLYTDRIYTGEEWQCALISLISTVTGIGFRETITGKINGPMTARVICTEQFGNSTTDLLQRIMRFITGMVTHLIMPLKILNLSMAQTIKENMPTSDIGKESFIRLVHSHLRRQLNGMQQVKATNGIASTAGKHGKKEYGTRVRAMSVVSYLCRLILLAPNGAPVVVAMTPKEKGMESQLVYDLTVENHACYQANGLLVSNCDAFMGFAQHYKRPVTAQYKSIMMG